MNAIADLVFACLDGMAALARNGDMLIAIFLALAAIIGSYLSYLAWKKQPENHDLDERNGLGGTRENNYP